MVNQSFTAARIRPRSTGGSPLRSCPVISSTTRSPRNMALSSARSIASHAWSRLWPCRSRIRSGSTDPLLRRLSHPPSSVLGIAWRRGGGARGRRGGGGAGLGFVVTDGVVAGAGAGADAVSSVPVSGRSRDNGRINAVTRAHSACSSADSGRTGPRQSRRNPLGQQQQCASLRRQAAGDRLGGRPRAPKGVVAIGTLDRTAGILRHP